MQIVERSALVTYTAAQMFALSMTCARYPEFLPWCVGAQQSKRFPLRERIATLKIARGVLQTEFTTRNTLSPDAKIHMQLMHGPFRDLKGEWRFEAIGTRGSRVYFPGGVRVQEPLDRGGLQRRVRDALCGSIVDAFVQRAKQVYAR